MLRRGRARVWPEFDTVAAVVTFCRRRCAVGFSVRLKPIKRSETSAWYTDMHHRKPLAHVMAYEVTGNVRPVSRRNGR